MRWWAPIRAIAPPRRRPDGQSVWPYTIEYEFVDPDYVQHVIVRNSSGSIIIERTFQQDYSSYATLLYDQMNDLIWLIVRDYQRADTAWGYDGQGDLDSVVITTTIPSGVLVSGWWITSEEDGYLRYVYATPFAGGATEHVGDVPTALTTAGFFGRAGVTVPDEPFEDWHINVFSAEGNWLARYPVRDRSGSGGEVYSVTIMAADSVIIYLAGISTGSEWRVIRP